MATLFGVEATKILNQQPTEPVDVGTIGGVMRMHYDKFNLSADLSTNDIIKMNDLLPKGARVIDAMVKYSDLDASGGTIDFGWAVSSVSGEAADENGFIEAADVTSADTIKASDNQANAAGIGKKFTESVQPQIKIEGDTDATSGSIETFIWYVMD